MSDISTDNISLPPTPAPDQAPAELTPPPPAGNIQVLRKLSSPPFPRGGFPLLGILASTYEHISAVAAKMKR